MNLRNQNQTASVYSCNGALSCISNITTKKILEINDPCNTTKLNFGKRQSGGKANKI